MKRAFYLLLLTASTQPVLAELGPDGMSGELTLLAGQYGQRSNFNTNSAIKDGNLNSSAESDSEMVFFPLGRINYTFGDNSDKQVFLGTSREDITIGLIALELGYQFELADSSILAISVLPSLINDETWSDPFVTGQERVKSDVSGNALRVQYKNILNSDYSLDGAIYQREIEDELSGEQGYAASTALLDRSGEGIYARASKRYKLSDTSFLTPSFRVNHFDADGEAMSSRLWGANVLYHRAMNKHSYALSGDYSRSEYDDTHPVFNQTQENTRFSTTLAYEYQTFMGWNNWAFNALLRYSNTDSNIEFYDETEWLTSIGLSYKF